MLQAWSIAKEDPLGIVLLVQPEGSCFCDGPKMRPYNIILAVHGTTTVDYLSANICREVRAKEHCNICNILRGAATA